MKSWPACVGGGEDGGEGRGVFVRLYKPTVRFTTLAIVSSLIAQGLIELAIAVVDGDFVPCADVDGVGVGEVGVAGGVEGDVGVGVVHDAVGLGDAAGGEVVGEAEGVAGFMGG